MPVNEYIPVLEKNLQAVLWQGNESDLDELPGLRNIPIDITGSGALHIFNPGVPGCIAFPGEHYVVRGVTGYFFVVPKATFEQNYLRVDPARKVEAYPPVVHEALTNLIAQMPPDRTRELNEAFAWLKSLQAVRQGQWEREPNPSYRDDDFLERCRFDSVDEAIQQWRMKLESENK